ncbi:MAG: YihY/virulence factor BrkB family protein [Planctomycetota bacterium]|nr:MAG: YihY/virulence factor BrkB family protein [Planctomycetota bacterium]
MSKFFAMLKTSVNDFIEDNCMASGAALAYYTIFSLPPLLVVVFLAANWFGVSDERIQEVVSRQIGMPIPAQQSDSESEGSADGSQQQGMGLGMVADRTSSVEPIEALGPLSKIIGAAILIFSATGVFAQLQYDLNRAWEVELDPQQSGWKNFLIKRLLSLGMIIVIAFLLLVSLVITTLVDEGVQMAVGAGPDTLQTIVAIVVNNAVTIALATVLFAAMFKVLPDAKIRWKDMWIGALITAVLFVIGKELIGWYLQNSAIGSAWGSAAASMIALLVWVYYTSLIVLFGAEFTQAWARHFGQGIEPEKGAVRVVEEKRELRDSGRAAGTS